MIVTISDDEIKASEITKKTLTNRLRDPFESPHKRVEF